MSLFHKTPIAPAPGVYCQKDLIQLEIRMLSTISPVASSPHPSTKRSLSSLRFSVRLLILSLALCAIAYGQDAGKPMALAPCSNRHRAAARESRQPSLFYGRFREGYLPGRLAYVGKSS